MQHDLSLRVQHDVVQGVKILRGTHEAEYLYPMTKAINLHSNGDKAVAVLYCPDPKPLIDADAFLRLRVTPFFEQRAKPQWRVLQGELGLFQVVCRFQMTSVDVTS